MYIGALAGTPGYIIGCCIGTGGAIIMGGACCGAIITGATGSTSFSASGSS